VVTLELSASPPEPDGAVMVRLLVVNASYDTVEVDRQLLWGPHPESGSPALLAAEPSTDDPADETVVLNPWGIVGRERRYRYDNGESVTFHGYLLRHPTDRLFASGPGDEAALEAAAQPLIIRFGG
jgi:hypothetical protein